MKTAHNVLSATAVIAALAAVVLYVLIGNQNESLQQELTLANGRIQVLEGRSAELASQRDVIEAQARALEDQLGEARARGVALETRSTQLAREIAKARQDAAAQNDATEARQREIAQLRRDLVQARSALLEQGSQAEVGALQEKIDRLEAALADRAAVGASPTIRISQVTSPRDFGIRSASVLGVGSGSAFVVLNIGSAHGARTGLQLTVDREGLSLARLQISEVNENYSIAQVEAGSLTGRLRVGDNAIILN